MSSLGPISAGVTPDICADICRYLPNLSPISNSTTYRLPSNHPLFCCAAITRYSIARLCCCTMAVDVVGAMLTMALLTSHEWL